jgi:hypothetical protein
MAGDPYWNETVLLLHCDGTNGSTTFTDQKGHAVTAFGNAQISTAQSVFGGASAQFDGTGDYLRIPDSADWDFGTGDFCLEGAVRLSAVTGSLQMIVSQKLNGVAVYVSASAKLAFAQDNVVEKVVGTTTLVAGTWYRFKINRVGGVTRLFLDGEQEGGDISDGASYSSTNPLVIGAGEDGTAVHLNGNIDELRVTKGAARGVVDYTLDAAPFPDAITKLSGVTKDATGALASKLVRAYRQDTGALVSQVVSTAGTGAFSLDAGGNVPYYITEHDTTSLTMAGSETANAAILDNLIPV